MRPRSWLAAALLALCLLLPASPVRAFLGDSQGAAGLDGSFRTLGAVVDNYSHPLLGSGRGQDLHAQSLARFTLAGRPGEYSYQAHLVASHSYNSAGGATAGPLFGGGQGLRYRAMNLSRTWLDETYNRGEVWLDRLNLKRAFAWGDLTVGRQAITFGKAYFWNPLDVFLPFDPRQFDRDYKPGVDAVRLDLPLGPFSGLTLAGAAGRQLGPLGQAPEDGADLAADWRGSALLARAFALLGGLDLSAQAGKVYGGWQAGFGLVGEALGWQARLEAAWFQAEGSPALPRPYSGAALQSGLTAVAGLGRRWPNSLDLQAEFLYNGLAEPEDLAASLARFRSGAALQASRYLLGVNLGCQPHPLLKASAVAMVSLADGSWQLQPLITYSLSDNSDLLAGASINRGERPSRESGLPESEFGSYPDLYFLQIKVYY